MTQNSDTTETTTGLPGIEISRRRLLGTVGAASAAGLALGAAGAALVQSEGPGSGTTGSGGAPGSLGATQVAFQGDHQSGITTPLQAKGHVLAFDLAPGAGRTEAAALMRRWSDTARRLMAGGTAPVADTGIALGSGPSSLSVTFGFGYSFFERTGLTGRRPAALDPLPGFSSDRLDAQRSNGDLWVQIGSDDALVAFHALRALQKDAGEAARPRWQMNGFNRSPGATAAPMTARNLMGQVDGTNNPKPTEADFDKRIFVQGTVPPEHAWMVGGSYAVVRRIRMLLDDWDQQSLAQQEQVIGRTKATGAPLTGGGETTAMALDKIGSDGKPVIASNAHARISAPAQNGGAAMLRRPFSFHDGIAADGTPDAGLLFICWQADPTRGFVPVQRKLDRGDALSQFIRHESSGLYAVPPGASAGEYVGQRLLEG
ncbi:iron uptake transporter deferrochelatase/peroxidase subunit [Streptomyces sp. H27-H1]|uniref:iron uptake transporter deferrochelatase/peroxidase subunit n=1 Tax=Streptomyces sp. H27-H1 TaxID=2996461 RepID=UPI00226DEE7D|nr:iron uptake transporter deferrochelatase/peroxidase subunit [Streptomyces sp. H27-H1]MCY0924782.1 iron uptake transporter deferrochelatase/peroxidase subunit [Streptomyces sp. H27-H1]